MELSHMQGKLTSTFILEDSPSYDRSNRSPQLLGYILQLRLPL